MEKSRLPWAVNLSPVVLQRLQCLLALAQTRRLAPSVQTTPPTSHERQEHPALMLECRTSRRASFWPGLAYLHGGGTGQRKWITSRQVRRQLPLLAGRSDRV